MPFAVGTRLDGQVECVVTVLALRQSILFVYMVVHILTHLFRPTRTSEINRNISAAVSRSVRSIHPRRFNTKTHLLFPIAAE